MPDENRIRRMVSRVVHRTLGLTGRSPAPRRRPLVTELDIRNLPHGSTYKVPERALITPLARQVAMDLNVTFVPAAGSQDETPLTLTNSTVSQQGSGTQVIAIGADHGGFKLKQELKSQLTSLGYTVKDCGTDSEQSVDYPDFAHRVAEAVSSGDADTGILICGTGIGMSSTTLIGRCWRQTGCRWLVFRPTSSEDAEPSPRRRTWRPRVRRPRPAGASRRGADWPPGGAAHA